VLPSQSVIRWLRIESRGNIFTGLGNLTMDAILSQAPEAPSAFLRNGLRFEGSASEYFKIWIVNLALTIVTLGVFSAWAKVRTRRYFYGNTFLLGHSFDYHAVPLRILLGRAIAVVLLLAYSLSVRAAPATAFFWVPLLFFAMPWLVRASLRFNARNTSYRNIRFDFVGTYFDAMKAFVLWWLLACFTLFTTLPLAHRARDYYSINNRRFGGQSFAAEIPGRKIYGIYGMGLLFIVGAIVAAIAMAAIFAATGLKADNRAGVGLLAGASVAVYMAEFLFVSVYVSTRTFNLALNHTTLNGSIRFESTLSPWRMIWIAYSNLVLVLVSVGLLYPWARIRSTRYAAAHIAMIGTPEMSDFSGTLTGSQGVIGEEVASFFDLDLGL
jgi:uncharacterized membrane protein YjgN (DUF898 family)